MIFFVEKLYTDVQLPKYGTENAAAFDVYSLEEYTLEPGERHTFKLGFKAEFPEGYVCLVWDRSGLASVDGITTLAGVIDSDFRGEYGVVLFNTSQYSKKIQKGDRIAQMLIQKIEHPIIQEVSKLAETTRTGGWGSTGR